MSKKVWKILIKLISSIVTTIIVRKVLGKINKFSVLLFIKLVQFKEEKRCINDIAQFKGQKSQHKIFFSFCKKLTFSIEKE